MVIQPDIPWWTKVSLIGTLNHVKLYGTLYLINHTTRTNGNPTAKAWLAGWDAAVSGLPGQTNPYLRNPQYEAWDCGFREGLRSGKRAARVTQHRIAGGRSRLAVITGGNG